MVLPEFNLNMNQDADKVPAKDFQIAFYRFMMGPAFFFQGIVFLSFNANVAADFNTYAGYFLGFLVWTCIHLLGRFEIISGFEQFKFKPASFWFYQIFTFIAIIVFALMSNLSDTPTITDPEAALYVYGIFFAINAIGMVLIPEKFWGQNMNLDEYDDDSKNALVDMSRMIFWR